MVANPKWSSHPGLPYSLHHDNRLIGQAGGSHTGEDATIDLWCEDVVGDGVQNAM
jgi:hypothetical protein